MQHLTSLSSQIFIEITALYNLPEIRMGVGGKSSFSAVLYQGAYLAKQHCVTTIHLKIIPPLSTVYVKNQIISFEHYTTINVMGLLPLNCNKIKGKKL